MSNLFQVVYITRNAFILNLRRLFTGDVNYPYVETVGGEFDFDNGKLYISDVIPQDHAFFPAIVVDTVAGPEQRYLGPEDLEQDKNNAHQVTNDRVFASLDLIVNINIYTIDDTIARDQLMDRIYDHFKLTTDDIAANGIEIKRTTFNTDTRTFLNDRWYLTGRLSIECYKEWTDDLGPGSLVTKIPITITLDF